MLETIVCSSSIVFLGSECFELCFEKPRPGWKELRSIVCMVLLASSRASELDFTEER